MIMMISFNGWIVISFSAGFLTGIISLMIAGIIYAKKQPRKVAQSMMKFELQTEEQNLARLKKKVKEAMNEK
jgi:hypothetical protein